MGKMLKYLLIVFLMLQNSFLFATATRDSSFSDLPIRLMKFQTANGETLEEYIALNPTLSEKERKDLIGLLQPGEKKLNKPQIQATAKGFSIKIEKEELFVETVPPFDKFTIYGKTFSVNDKTDIKKLAMEIGVLLKKNPKSSVQIYEYLLGQKAHAVIAGMASGAAIAIGVVISIQVLINLTHGLVCNDSANYEECILRSSETLIKKFLLGHNKNYNLWNIKNFKCSKDNKLESVGIAEEKGEKYYSYKLDYRNGNISGFKEDRYGHICGYAADDSGKIVGASQEFCSREHGLTMEKLVKGSSHSMPLDLFMSCCGSSSCRTEISGLIGKSFQVPVEPGAK